MSSRLFALTLCAGCAGDSTTAPPPPGVLAAEIGTGEEAYVPLDDGDDLSLVHGPQGGWHFTISIRISGVSESVGLHPVATILTTGATIAGHQGVEFRDVDPYDALTRTGDALDLRVFLAFEDTTEMCPIEGQEVEIVYEVEDLATDATIEARRVVRARLDPIDVADCHR